VTTVPPRTITEPSLLLKAARIASDTLEVRRLALASLLALTCAASALAAPPKSASSWAAPQIAKVVAAGFLASSAATFEPDQPLTQQALADAVATLNEHLAAPVAPDPEGDPLVVEGSAEPAPPWTPYVYRAASPAKPVTIAELDRVLVKSLGLARAAEQVRTALVRAGLKPPARTGTETVARLLGLRFNHPAGSDDLELLPGQPATRAEAAFSLAAALSVDAARRATVEELAASLELPAPTDWQRTILRSAVRFVGYPYVWAGTGATASDNLSRGTQPAARSIPPGFDCAAVVWKIYKLTAYAGSGDLASTLRGRTTYEMSGEVGPASRIYDPASLEPGDVLFFGAGPKSKPSQVDHEGIYLGGNWMIHSSRYGVTLIPLDGWWTGSFAWARRPLREAGLDS
jgi:cell wall-associated NlpC family hydrolase